MGALATCHASSPGESGTQNNACSSTRNSRVFEPDSCEGSVTESLVPPYLENAARRLHSPSGCEPSALRRG
jgi:hypothetical protein